MTSSLAEPATIAARAASDDLFERERPLLFAIAYRMLGSAADAEDVVQDAYLRWDRHPPAKESASRAYLCSIVTRLCIDHLKSARVRREEYVGPWLPEPLLEPVAEDALDATIRTESLSMAFLLLLERLSPTERAAFLLREVFSFNYDEIGAIIGRTEAATRQLVKRARDRIPSGGSRFTATAEEAKRVTARFVEACSSGDLAALLELLTDEVVTLNDGGGKARAARNPIHGPDRVARFYVGIFRKWRRPQVRIVTVNGQPGLVVRTASGQLRVISFAIREGRLERIFLVVNPEKLRHVLVEF